MPTVLGKLPRHGKTIQAREDEHRGSARDRGYTARWDRISKARRTQRPYCEECLRWKRFRKTVYVDHKVPLRAPFHGALLDSANHWCLCRQCHDGMKAWLEAEAERTGRLSDIAAWCDDPSSRPAGWRTRD